MTLDLPPDPEPIGKVIILIREYLADHGDLTGSGSLDFTDTPVRGTESEADEAPYVIVKRSTISSFPFGAGSGRMGLADHVFTVQCYGRRLISGEREAARLAALVRAALHNHPPVIMGDIAIHRIRVLGTGAPLREDVTAEPFVPLNIGLYAGALAPAS